MSRSISHLVWITLAASLSAACGNSGGMGTPVARFPELATLEEVASQPFDPPRPLPTADVDAWTLEGAARRASPSIERLYRPRIERRVAESGGALSASPALDCAAHETARFFVEQGAFPSGRLRAYLVARCGSTLPTVQVMTLHLEVPGPMSDEDLASGTADSVRQLVDDVSAAGGELGFGFARGGGKAVFVAYSGRPEIRLRSFSSIAAGKEVTLEGRVLNDSSRATGLVTRGKFGVRPCEPDRRVAFPSFRITCPFDPADAQARIEVATSRRDQVLASPALVALVRRHESAGLEYRRLGYVTPRERGRNGETEAGFRGSLLELLNQARRDAGVGVLTLDEPQSQFNERFTPGLFAASLVGDDESETLLTLGMLAGWQVRGVIRDGGFFAGTSEASKNAAAWLNGALDSPLGRKTLMDERMTKIAIGYAADRDAGGLAAITTYSFFEEKSHAADEDAVFDELSKQRKARGKRAARRRTGGAELGTALSAIASGTNVSGTALQAALQQVATRERSAGVSGWVVETSDLSAIEFPDLLLDGEADIEVGITHYKAPDGAWGQYVVLFIVHGQSPSTI